MSRGVVALEPARSWWTRVAWAVLLIHVVLIAAQWPLLPWFLDSYYHLNVVRAFQRSGGVVLWESWEFAPLGRPHLYPPLLHVLMAAVGWLVRSPVTLARLASLTAFPAVVACTWWWVARHVGEATAYWAVVCSVVPFSYLLVGSNTIAASLACVVWLLNLAAIARGAGLAAALSGALVFYAHLGVPWLMAVSWLAAWVMMPSRRAVLWRAALASIAIASPWLAHLARHARLFGPMSSLENTDLEIPVVLYGLAAGGAILAVKAPVGSAKRLMLAVMIGLLPLLWHYRFRFVSGQGLLGIVLLASLALTAAVRALQDHLPRRCDRWRWMVPCAVTALLVLGNPTLFVRPAGITLGWGDSSLTNLARAGERISRSTTASLYRSSLIDPLVAIVRAHTRPDEIIGCDLPYVCGMLAALSDRALATGMLAEVRANVEPADALGRAQLLVWLKTESPPEIPALDELQRRWRLERVAETEVASVWRNPQARETRRDAAPVVPLGWAEAIAVVAMAVIGWDLSRHAAVQEHGTLA